MGKKRDWKKFLTIFNNKLFIGIFIFVIFSIASVFAGNIIVKEGSIFTENNGYFEGKVGIGDTTPDTILDVTGSGPHGIVLNQDTVTPTLSSRLFFKSNAETFSMLASSSSLQFRSDAVAGSSTGTARMTLDGDGNVGIGDTTPPHLLTVGDMDNAGLDKGNLGVKTDSNGFALYLEENSGAEGWQIGVNANGDLEFFDSTGSPSKILFQDVTGNVGIGTTTPATKLHIVDTTTAQLRIDYNASNFGSVQVTSTGKMFLRSLIGTDPDLELRTPNFDNALLIDDSTNRVGIGTGSPGSTLDVNGAITSGQIIINTVNDGDAVDVSNVNSLKITPTVGSVRIGGFVGGVEGQVLHLFLGIKVGNSATIEHNENTVNQNIFLHSGADEVLTADYGGWILVCDGTNWYDTSN